MSECDTRGGTPLNIIDNMNLMSNDVAFIATADGTLYVVLTLAYNTTGYFRIFVNGESKINTQTKSTYLCIIPFKNGDSISVQFETSNATRYYKEVY